MHNRAVPEIENQPQDVVSRILISRVVTLTMTTPHDGTWLDDRLAKLMMMISRSGCSGGGGDFVLNRLLSSGYSSGIEVDNH